MSEFEYSGGHKLKKKKSRDHDSSKKKKKRMKSMPCAMESLQSSEYMRIMRSLHDDSQPYRHVVLDPLCDHDTLAKVHDEIKHNMTATYKETDLFKVFQTGELGNITADDELGAKMPELLKLREKIYSKEFRTFVQNITGCEELTDRVDFSGNAYTCQCHLMCHDDVISTRCISFIIYLTDPDETWTAADGGALELYPLDRSSVVSPSASGDSKRDSFQHHSSFGKMSSDALESSRKNESGSRDEQGVPAAVPTLSILPKFNSMAMFVVQPGRSYHAVQEVFGDSPRLSISGWFHAAEPPVGSDLASLKQIMSKGDIDVPFVEVPSAIFDGLLDEDEKDKTKEEELQDMKFSEHDMRILKQYVNTEYLLPECMLEIRDKFIEESSIQLYDFLNDDIAKLIAEASFESDAVDHLGEGKIPSRHTLGSGKRWSLIGPPHKHKYLRYDSSTEPNNQGEDVGALLSDIRHQLFRSPAFQKYLYKITNMQVRGYRDEIRRFRPGLDYTVAHHGTLVESPRMDATLCFSDTRTKEKAELWDGGDVGGFECYIAAEDDTDADATAEVYKTEDEDNDKDGDLLSVQAGCNVLNIVMRDEGVMKFVKYVSHKAPSSRWDLAIEYEVEMDEDDDDFTDDDDSDEDNSDNPSVEK